MNVDCRSRATQAAIALRRRSDWTRLSAQIATDIKVPFRLYWYGPTLRAALLRDRDPEFVDCAVVTSTHLDRTWASGGIVATACRRSPFALVFNQVQLTCDVPLLDLQRDTLIGAPRFMQDLERRTVDFVQTDHGGRAQASAVVAATLAVATTAGMQFKSEARRACVKVDWSHQRREVFETLRSILNGDHAAAFVEVLDQIGQASPLLTDLSGRPATRQGYDIRSLIKTLAWIERLCPPPPEPLRVLAKLAAFVTCLIEVLPTDLDDATRLERRLVAAGWSPSDAFRARVVSAICVQLDRRDDQMAHDDPSIRMLTEKFGRMTASAVGLLRAGRNATNVGQPTGPAKQFAGHAASPAASIELGAEG